MIDASVFKAYDVRGLYPSEITEGLFHQLGRAFVAYLGPGRYAVTRDMRLSSPSLTKAFIDGAVKQGGHIVDYGLCGTDQMYFAVAADGLDGGAQVTASHNPGEYNGCKMVRKDAFPLSGEAGIKEMKDMILAGAIPAPPATPGSVERGELMDRYVEHVLSFVDETLDLKPFNVVLDAGSGVAGIVAPRLFDRLPCKTTRLVLRSRRHLSQSRSQSADRGEPRRHHRRGDQAERRHRHCLGRRRGSGVLHRRQRRVHRRRFHHRAAGRGVSAQVAGRNDHLRRARQLRGQGHRREVPAARR